MERCRNLVKKFSNNIKISVGLDKCTAIYIEKRNAKNSTENQKIPCLKQKEGCKYLNVFKSNSIKHNKTKGNAKKEFFKRIRSILKPGTNVPLVSFQHTPYPSSSTGLGSSTGPKRNLRESVERVRKMLTKDGF